jgi:hypothetical protein
VYVADSEPDALVEATAAAVDWWNERLGFRALVLRVTSTPRAAYLDAFAVHVRSRDKLRTPTAADGTPSSACATPLGLTNVITVRPYAVDTMADVTLQWLLAHELGHVLGLAHSSDAENLMYEGRPQQFHEGHELTRKQRRRARAIAGLESGL